MVLDQADHGVYDGLISGNGALIKNGIGFLSLTRANTYTGGTTVNAGILEVAATGALDSGPLVANQAAVSFIGNTSAGSLIITNNQSSLNFFDDSSAGRATITNDGGGLSFCGNSTAADATTVNNLGAPLIFLMPLSGQCKNHQQAGGFVDISPLEAPEISIGSISGEGVISLGSKTLVLGALGYDDSINGVIQDDPAASGSLVKVGAGTLTLSADNTYDGATVIAGGTLIVNGSIANSAVTVSGNAKLGGIGTVGTTTVNAGGTIAPGRSPGTLTVNGDIIFASGSIYEIDITPALDGDLVKASGQAMIEGGTAHVLKTPGTYTPGSRWTIIGADGGVVGKFDALAQNMPFVDLSLNYDSTHVYLDVVRNAVSFCDVARTFNQCSTGDGLESSGPGDPVYDIVASIPEEGDARQAFDALSGEIYGSVTGALLEDSRFVREAALDRVRSAIAGPDPSLPVMGYGSEESREALAGEHYVAALAPAPAATSQRPFLWARGFGSWGEWESDGNAAQFERSIGGAFIGADVLVGGLRIGLLSGYSHSSFNADDRSSSGSRDDFHLGLYAGTAWGNLGLRFGAAHTWHEIETRRSIVFPGLAEEVEASYDARTAQAFGEIGYRIDRGGPFAIEPFVGLAHVNVHRDGFSEGGGTAALSVRGDGSDVTFSTIGLRASAAFRLGTAKATARGMVGWRHAFGDMTPFSTHAFAGSDAFAVAGTPLAEDALVIETGLDIGLSQNASLAVSYSGQISSKASDHGLRANFTLKF